MWLLDASGAAAVPLSAVRGGFVVADVPPDDRRGRPQEPAVELRAALAPERPGPYRVLARFDRTAEGAADARDALDTLVGIASQEPDRAVQWADGQWCYLDVPEPLE